MKRGARPSPGHGPRILLLSLLLAGSGITAIPLGLRAQDVLPARSASGEVTLPLARHRGFPAVPAGSLTRLGFQAVPGADGRHRLAIPGGSVLVFMEDNPFVALDGDLLQLVHPPYRIGSELYLPRPLFEDVLPMRRPALFRMEGGTFLILASPLAVQPTPSAPATPPGPVPVLRGPTPPSSRGA